MGSNYNSKPLAAEVMIAADGRSPPGPPPAIVRRPDSRRVDSAGLKKRSHHHGADRGGSYACPSGHRPGDEGNPARLPAFLSCMNASAPADEPKAAITHGFLATGAETYIRDGQGKITWRYPHPTRDGWVLPDGNILLACRRAKIIPMAASWSRDRDGKVVFEYKGTQAEVNTAQAIDGDES